MKIRPASIEDCQHLFDWRNDRLSQTMFVQTEQIDYQSHCAWFQKVLLSQNRKIYIGLVGQTRIGMCRFDIDDLNQACISINVAPGHRSKGYAKILLNKSIEMIKCANPTVKCIAEVKTINVASQRLFEGCDFKLIDKNPDLRRYALD